MAGFPHALEKECDTEDVFVLDFWKLEQPSLCLRENRTHSVYHVVPKCLVNISVLRSDLSLSFKDFFFSI